MSLPTASEVLEGCAGSGNGTDVDVLHCVTQELLNQTVKVREQSRTTLLMYSAALVFFMQAGFAMLCAGAVRRKNVQNTLLKNFLDACGSSVAFFAVGYAFAFGDNEDNPNQFLGTNNFFLSNVDNYGFWFFQYAFSAASATIVAGTLAERCQMAAYFSYSMVLAGFVYPVVAHSIWSPYGFLSNQRENPLFGVGVTDFAGSGVVHMTGGATALYATTILGPRRGRFHDEEGRRLRKPNDFPGHSMALQMLGTFILWFGWYGFSAGAGLVIPSEEKEKLTAIAGVNTTLSGGAAGLVAVFIHFFYLDRTTGEPYFDPRVAMNGSLSGLVAITAGAALVQPWAAVLIGALAGTFYLIARDLLVRMRLDDAVDAIPVHMFNGLWGMISVSLLACEDHVVAAYTSEFKHVGLFYSFANGGFDGHMLAANIIGILWIIGWTFFIMMPFFFWLDWKGWFRSDPLEEIVGLDTSYHGGLLLTTGEDAVNPEYISQFQQKRNELRNRYIENRKRQSSNFDGEEMANEDCDSVKEDDHGVRL
eukprot:Nitzschia sp. Nitz4//scaffold297_size22919//1667//3508//NITZ4_008517-RA/size22919-augustus-gene-0.5-mRNA-1//1//CDS//3329546286//7745//frame0